VPIGFCRAAVCCSSKGGSGVQPCLFCGGDASEPNHLLHCDGRQGHADAGDPETRAGRARPQASDRTRTTAEAMDVLEEFRAAFLQQARDVAHDLIRREGSTHTRAVRAEMARRGYLDDERVREHWLGAVFNNRAFVWTGEWHLPTGPSDGYTHAWRPVKVWRGVGEQ